MNGRMNFFFGEAIRSLTTNIATSVAATLSMLIALLLIALTALYFLLPIMGLGSSVGRDASRVKVFLQETATDNDVNAIRTRLERMPEVQRVDFISKDDALARAKKLFKDEPDLIRNIQGNPFPASLEATLRDSSKAATVAGRIKGEQGIDKVVDGGAKGKQIARAARFIGIGAIVFLTFLVIAATMLIGNTIRLSIFARRREIEVMKLVGASNWFVRWPFMMEGFLCGLAAAVGAIVITLGTASVMNNVFERLDLVSAFKVNEHILPVSVVLLGLGVLLGGIGSGFTIRRYLRI